MSAYREATDMIEKLLGLDAIKWIAEASKALRDAGMSDGPLASLSLAACGRPEVFHMAEAMRVKPSSEGN